MITRRLKTGSPQITFLRLCVAGIYLLTVGLNSLVFCVAQADIVTDGTVGPAQSLSGPAFVIPENLGSRAGANLFHSFQRFDINTGEQATFTGSATIANVISRVTGGQHSNINGLLRSSIGNADFYFINPAGFVFGANAQLDVPASFNMSTADELRFPDGNVYSATNPVASTLSIDQPESFGFLGDQTANITFSASNLQLNPGNTLSISAGNIMIDKALFLVEQGEIQLAAIGDKANAMTVIGDLSVAAEGDLTINESTIDMSGDGAGLISIAGGYVNIIAAEILANNSGSIDAAAQQGININSHSLTTEDSNLRSRTSSSGNAGNISVSAVEVQLLDSSRWSSSTFDAGQGGNITIKVDHLNLDGLSGISANTDDTGNAGHIVINGLSQQDSKLIEINGGSSISSSTFANGNGGNININVDNIIVSGGQEIPGCCIFPSALRTDAQREAGAQASAGILFIQAENITVQEKAVISAVTGGMGTGGSIVIDASSITLLSSGEIITFARGSGKAGSINVTADSIIISGISPDDFTGIGAQAFEESSGQAGNILLNVNQLALSQHGQINIQTRPEVDQSVAKSIQPAVITITAQNISLLDATITTESQGNIPAGLINLATADTLSLNSATISTAANNANGGAISIQTSVIDMQNSQITTSVSGQGNGGNINLDAQNLLLDTGFIQANTNGVNASGGDIAINTDALVANHNILLSGGGTPLSIQPGLNVIQAAAPDGVSGNIDISSPQLDISGDLIDLDSELQDIDDLAQNPCATTGGKQSTLVSLGRGGLPESPQQAGTIKITPVRLQRLLTHPDDLNGPESGISPPNSNLHFRPELQTLPNKHTSDCL